MDILSTIVILVIAVGAGLLLTLPFIRSEKGAQENLHKNPAVKVKEAKSPESKIPKIIHREKHD